MDVEFVIPLSKDDLLDGEPGAYVVEEVIPMRILPNKIAGTRRCEHLPVFLCFQCNDHVELRFMFALIPACIDDLNSTEGACSVLQNFDVFFSLIRYKFVVSPIHNFLLPYSRLFGLVVSNELGPCIP